MFSNTESVSKNKHNLTYRVGQKMKLQTLVHISPPRAPLDHIWAMVWSGARGNITI